MSRAIPTTKNNYQTHNIVIVKYWNECRVIDFLLIPI